MTAGDITKNKKACDIEVGRVFVLLEFLMCIEITFLKLFKVSGVSPLG